jgi:hypothetical protein
MGLDLGLDAGESTDRTGERAGADLVPSPQQALAVAAELGMEGGKLEAEGGGLRLDAVAAADAGRVLVLEGPPLECCQHPVHVVQQEIGRPAELDRQRGVQEVGGGEPPVQEPGRLAADLLDMGEKGNHVVPRRLLDGVHPARVDQPLTLLLGTAPEACDRVRGHHALLGHGLGGGQLDLQPDRELLLGREDARHLRAAVAWDHSQLVLCRRAGGF